MVWVSSGMGPRACASVGAVHHTGVLLGRAHIAGVLEGDPGVACLEQHREHLAPEVDRRHLAVGLDLTPGGFFFVSDIGFLELGAKQVVQVRHVRR